MHIFVPDTNFFLQCLDYQTLDWSLVSKDIDVTVVVPRAVQREIDRHKDGGNARRASRARKASGLFAQLLDSDDNRITTIVRNFTVSVELLMPRINAQDFPELDLQNPDDLIVAEALWVKRRNAGVQVTFLSNDTAALVTAKSQQLSFQRLPTQWKLPPEKDERDKTIEELRKTVARLSSVHPELTFAVVDIPDNRIAATITLFPALTRSEIETLMDEIGTMFPMESDFPQEPPARHRDDKYSGLVRSLNLYQEWKPASAQEIDYYQKKAYPEWLRQTRSTLENIHRPLNDGLYSTMTLVIGNAGQQPAKNLLISLQAEGAIVFGKPASNDDHGNDDQDKPLFTTPPTPPAGAYVNIADRFMALHAMSGALSPNLQHRLPTLRDAWAKQRRDPNSFYWKTHRPTEEATEWTLECDEFRHQHEPHALEITFRPSTIGQGTVTGAIRCQAHASNLLERVELVVPVRILVEQGDTLDQVREELFRLR
ncbi:PIN domain-containing protein [Burkholderia sp. BCC1977]|uniref:PIN domain-containing protein n=1 Tax=Burkholderia sp. BCC1977 TaxID=2817440 RepID=UPI002ABE4D97|nr:PIN domain-containing protein [Burkholderia sp. BCC1977]